MHLSSCLELQFSNVISTYDPTTTCVTRKMHFPTYVIYFPQTQALSNYNIMHILRLHLLTHQECHLHVARSALLYFCSFYKLLLHFRIHHISNHSVSNSHHLASFPFSLRFGIFFALHWIYTYICKGVIIGKRIHT